MRAAVLLAEVKPSKSLGSIYTGNTCSCKWENPARIRARSRLDISACCQIILFQRTFRQVKSIFLRYLVNWLLWFCRTRTLNSRLHAAAALAVFCFNSQKNIDQIQEAIGMLTKSAMDELIDSKHPAYRYDAAFGEWSGFRWQIYVFIRPNRYFQTK